MSILQRLANIKELPTLPQTLVETLSLVNSDTADAKRIAQVIERDPPLCAKVLKVANSALYGLSGKRISSVSFAVSRLGFDEVKKLVIAISFIKQFPHAGSVLDYDAFWRHSLLAAYLTQSIGSRGHALCAEDRDVYFLCGLLHDIGTLMYDQFFHEEFNAIVNYALSQEISFLEAEQSIASRESHPALGGALLELWRLDPAVIAAVRYHHAPEMAPEKYRRIVSLLALAESIICTSILGSFEGSSSTYPVGPAEYLSIDSGDWNELLGLAAKEIEKCAMLIAVASSGMLSSV